MCIRDRLIIDFTPLVPFSFIYYTLICLCIAPIIYSTVLLDRKPSAFISCVVFLSIVLSHYEVENHYLFALQRVLETITGIPVSYTHLDVYKRQTSEQDT